jgi:large subunit ribosomal protein L1
MKIGKRLKNFKAKIDNMKVYEAAEAVKLVKETASLKFDATIEAHAKLGIDPKKGEQIVRASVNLPHGSGKKVRIAAFVADTDAKKAMDAGATIAGGEALIEEIKKTGKCDFDIAITVPDMMKHLAAIARVLGQKGLMPNPKTGTIGTDIVKMIEELKKGKVTYKNDDTANVHLAIGKASYTEEQILANFEAFVDSLKKAKPQNVKGVYVKSVHISSTMGPSVKVATN